MTLNDILKKIKGTVLRTEPEEEIIPEVGQVWGTPIQDLLKNKFPNRNAKGNKPTTFFPEKIPVLSYEKNASEIRIDHWIIAGSNVVRDDNRNKAADLGQARPVTLIIFGKAFVAYTIDADRGVGVNILLAKAVADLTTTAEEAWAFLESSKLAKWASEDLTGRQKLLFLFIGIIIGQLVFLFFKV